MKNYNINISETTQKKAESALEKEIKKINTKLKKKDLDLLKKPKKVFYLVSSSLTNGIPAKGAVPANAEYKSRESFDAAISAAQKAYGKTPYKVSEFRITQSYNINQKQLDAINNTTKKRKKAPTAEPLSSKKGSEISNYLKF